jgi:hypothetical protein
MDALINHCLKPVASTLPLATDEIKKLHNKRFFFKVDAMHAFWAIPLDEESKKMLAFQTLEGVFAWSRSPWDADRPVKSNKQHFTMLWINTCRRNFATE